MRKLQCPRILSCVALLCGTLALSSHVEAKPKAVKMDRTLRRQLNTFFSNFSETDLGPFRRGRLGDKQKIEFAFLHEYLNDAKREYPCHVSAKRVDALANWYFGAPIKQHRFPGSPHENEAFRNGVYTYTMGDGDPIAFSQIVTLTNLQNGEFAATTNDYWTHEEYDPHGDYSPTKNKNGDVWEGVQFTGKHKAIIKRVGTGARRRFILLEYQILSTNR